MGQKVHPHGLRVGIIKDWDSRWFADKADFGDLLVEDYKVRELIKKETQLAGVSRIEIERASKRIKVTIFTAKPGMVIGKGGAGVEALRKKLEKLTGKSVIVNIEEIKNQDANAQLVAENIAGQLERRISFRRAMKQAIQRSMRAGVKGIKTQVSGRVGGADMARTEGYSEGTIPLQTLRADIDYGFAEADTTYGKIGVKVWLYKGEVLPGMKAVEEVAPKKGRKPNRRGRDNKRGRADSGKRFNKRDSGRKDGSFSAKNN
ncbi:MAG: 30S ribosomal protein S3 [Tissierellia bacterium]|nr:30S ribosomal protein S3 [Tissierellia bacterium]